MIAIRQVLVATDFSADSATALEYGRALARTFGAALHVLHVVEDVSLQLMMAGGTVIGGATIVDLQRELEAAAAAQLHGLVREDDVRELSAREVLRTGSAAARAIADYAAEAAIDLVVIGTHGRSGMAHLLMGSVAEKVVRTAPCPVLTVRQPQAGFLRPDAIQRASTPIP
jgi:universal stress protein A